ncbi:MAG: Nif3-like dinuclear metal center hexameric protein [Gemmatimonadota bacterium]|nr:MAG: Nif3-like dinuclear metal center hexameric protein [Gemmatimonadota bacterium]
MATDLRRLTRYLDDYLGIVQVPDRPEALNGLQVENSGVVNRVAAAVDACQVSIDATAARGADFLLVHHGLFWRGLEPLTGRHGRRVRKLIESDIAVYSAHIPLDVHPEVGNNARLADLMGIMNPEPFADPEGQAIGLVGEVDLSLGEFITRLRQRLAVEPHVIAAGPDRLTRVAVVSGGGGGLIGHASDAGADLYLTGEGSHHTHFDAEELRLNVVYAGHYATETVGVKALASHIEEEFGLPWDFLDHPTGL